MLTGNIVSICFSGLVCIVVSLFNPQDFDWALLKEIPTIEEQAEVSRCHARARRGMAELLSVFHSRPATARLPLRTAHLLTCPPIQVEDAESSPEALTKALTWTYWTGGALTLVMIILWPLLAIPAGVFSKGYFTMVSNPADPPSALHGESCALPRPSADAERPLTPASAALRSAVGGHCHGLGPVCLVRHPAAAHLGVEGDANGYRHLDASQARCQGRVRCQACRVRLACKGCVLCMCFSIDRELVLPPMKCI
jgi:hypothetical protein